MGYFSGLRGVPRYDWLCAGGSTSVASVSRDLEAPVSLDGVVLAIQMLPLPDGMMFMPVLATDNSSSLPERQSWREQHKRVAYPSRDLSRERPFATSDASSDTGGCPLITDVLKGCSYIMTSYGQMAKTDVDPIYGLQLNHSRFLEFIGAPELARLLTWTPSHWVRTMARESAVAAALHLQRDAGLMTSNLQVMSPFVMSLNRMSSEIIRMAIGPEAFPSVMMNVVSPVPWAPHAAHYMAAMGLWRPPDGPCTHGPLPGSS